MKRDRNCVTNLRSQEAGHSRFGYMYLGPSGSSKCVYAAVRNALLYMAMPPNANVRETKRERQSGRTYTAVQDGFIETNALARTHVSDAHSGPIYFGHGRWKRQAGKRQKRRCSLLVPAAFGNLQICRRLVPSKQAASAGGPKMAGRWLHGFCHSQISPFVIPMLFTGEARRRGGRTPLAVGRTDAY